MTAGQAVESVRGDAVRDLVYLLTGSGPLMLTGCGLLALSLGLFALPKARIPRQLPAYASVLAWQLVLLQVVYNLVMRTFGGSCGTTWGDVLRQGFHWAASGLALPLILSVPLAIIVAKRGLLGAYAAHKWSLVATLVVILDLVLFLAMLDCAVAPILHQPL